MSIISGLTDAGKPKAVGVTEDGRLKSESADDLLAEQFLCWRAAMKCTIHGDGLLGHFAKARNRAKFTLKL